MELGQWEWDRRGAGSAKLSKISPLHDDTPLRPATYRLQEGEAPHSGKKDGPGP